MSTPDTTSDPFLRLAQGTPSVLLAWSRDGRVTEVSEGARDWLGTTPQRIDAALTFAESWDHIADQIEQHGGWRGQVTPKGASDETIFAQVSGDGSGRFLLVASRFSEQEHQRVAYHKQSNLIAMIQAITRISSRGVPEHGAFADRLVARISVISTALAAQAQQAPDGGLKLRTLIDSVLAADGAASAQIERTGPEVSLPSNLVLPVAQILHEWLENARMHAADQAVIDLDWALDRKGRCTLRWTETGSAVTVPTFGAHAPAGGAGFGLVLAYHLAQQIHGTLEFGCEGNTWTNALTFEP